MDIQNVSTSWLVLFFLILIYFRKKGREGEREGGEHQCERETSIGCLLYVLRMGTWPATQTRALTGIKLVTFHFAG